MNILAHTSFIGTTGYANHAQSFFTALDKLNPLKVRNFTVGKSWKGYNNTPHDKEPYITPQIKKILFQQTLLENNETSDYPIYSYSNDFNPDINIILNEHDHYYFYDDYNGYNIAYNVWECTKYEDNFLNQLKKFDELWVPTEWQKEISIKQGYPEDKIFVIPEGVNGKLFKPSSILKKKDKFQFVIIGRWDHRKGIKDSIEGFLKAFPNNDDVELLLNVENPYPVDGLNSTEERLKYHGLEDDRIKILKFLTRKEYIKLLQNSNVLISCAKSEGWNLPLIESLSCGTPSIYTKCSGQLEFTEGKGLGVEILGEEPASNGRDNLPGNFYTPDLNDLVDKIKDSYYNYTIWKQYHLKQSKEIRNKFSWENQAKLAYKRLNEIKNKTNNFSLNKNLFPTLEVNFVEGPYALLRGVNEEHTIEFFDQSKNKTEYTTTLKNNHWSKTYHRYFIDWDIRIKNKQGNLIISHKYDASNKKVFISLGSKSLGDTLAWFPYVLEFQKKHNCKIIVSTFWNKFFIDTYPELEFVEPGTKVEGLYAMYEVGWFYKDETEEIDYFQQPMDPRSISLQQAATNILGLDYKELIPKISYKIKDRPIKEKYICISPHASASAKYWHHTTGWQDVIDYINNTLNYKVLLISHEKYDDEFQTSKLPKGKKFKNIIDFTGDHPIEDIINIIHHSELYIGVSSGLAWLSWALNKPVIMISGFSSEWTEFSTKINRIINKNVCNSCFNNHKLDAGDWEWCPVHKDTPRQFECTKKISPKIVIESIISSLV